MKDKNYSYLLAPVGYTILFALALGACKPPSPKKKAEIQQALTQTKQIDNSIQAYYNNKLYIPNIIRIAHPSGKAFIYVDTLKTKPGLQRLLPSEKEPFYTAEAAHVSAADIAAYNLAWDLPEIQALQTGDGGYGTVFTTIGQRPGKDTGVYIIEIRRNNIQEFALHTTLAYVKYDVASRQTWVADNSGYYVPLSSFRAIRN